MRFIAHGMETQLHFAFKIDVLRGDVMMNNIYLTNEQKELIVLMIKERRNRIMEVMERLTRQYISDEDYQIIRKSLVFALDELDELRKVVEKQESK